MKTYDWIHATATSKSSNIKRPPINSIRLNILSVGPWDPSKVKSKWPATILAANRIESVSGRIMFLTVSITTITGIRKLGVPVGTKCAKRLLYWYKIDINILPNHRGSAKVRVKDMCLLLVKIYGNKPIKLLNRIKKKILIKIKIVPWITDSPKTAFNSFSKKKTILVKDLDIWEFINQNIWGIKITPIKIANQFNIKFKDKIFTDGSNEENRFIIQKFYCFYLY